MTVVRVNSIHGRKYGSDFLEQMVRDLRQLAIDFERDTGKTSGAETLLRAANVVDLIQTLNAK